MSDPLEWMECTHGDAWLWLALIGLILWPCLRRLMER